MQMVGNLLSSYLMDRLGRKLTIVGSSAVVILASAILSLAPSYPLLLLGCLLNGSSVGCVRPAVGLYISEIATVRWRGTLSSLYALTPNAG
jgi:MFS family permease